MKYLSLISFPLVFLTLSGCHSANNRQQVADTGFVTETQSKSDTFMKVFRSPVGDSVYLDSMLLQITTSGQQVTGTYQWVIPGKDGKSGKLTGILSGSVIHGHYHYRQEGGNHTDSIKIILKPGEAVIKQFNEGVPLIDTLPRRR